MPRNPVTTETDDFLAALHAGTPYPCGRLGSRTEENATEDSGVVLTTTAGYTVPVFRNGPGPSPSVACPVECPRIIASRGPIR